MVKILILAPLVCAMALNLPLNFLRGRISFLLAMAMTVAEMIMSFNPSIDSISRVLLLSIGIISFTALIVGSHTFKSVGKRFDFISLLLLMMAGLNGVVLVKDIFSLYVYIEVVAASSFILIAFDKAPDALEAAFKYIILSTVATVLMLCAIGILLLVSGDTSFMAIKNALNVETRLIASLHHNFFIVFAIAIFICGLFIKAGLMPFHGWLPDAYAAAPAGVSILLAGIVTKTVGVYSLVRIVNSVFGFSSSINQVLMLVGAVSIVFGALVALTQSDFKRMLAYSSISQVGYIIIGLGCGTALGVAGAIFHLFNHAIFKSLLFVNSAAVESKTGTRDMNKLSGIAERMPLTGITSAIGSLSAAGIPPLSGFWSKLMIVVALWISGNYFYAVVAIIAGVITLGYFLSMQRRVFFGKIKEELRSIKEADFAFTLPALILSFITIGVGLAFPFIYNAFLAPLRSVFGG